MKNSHLARVLWSLGLLLWINHSVLAQGFQGTIRGEVQDSTGGVVPMATVTLTNTATSETRTQVASETGTFNFPNLLVSTYTVVVEYMGFKKYTRENVQVSANAVSDVLARLEVGATADSVVVTAGEESVKLSTTQLEGFTTRNVTELPNPVLSGSPNNFAILAPGTTTMPGGVAGQGGSIGGNRPRNNNFVVDGVDNNDPSITGTLTPVIAEAVEEFKLLTNQFNAEYGHSTAGQFIITTKSGTNDLHGRMWWYNQNRNTNALDNLTRAVTPPGSPKPRFDWNRFGGQTGGPVMKNKLFFFSSYEYQNKSLAGVSPAQTLVPTDVGLSALKNLASKSGSGVSPVNVDILSKYVPVAATQTTTTNVVDETTGSPVSISLGQFSATTPNFDRTHLFLGNSDYLIGSHRLSTRYSFSHDTFIVAGTLPIPQFNSNASVNTQRLVFSDVFAVNPRVVNEFRAGYNRFLENRLVTPPAAPGSTDVFGNYEINDLGLLVGPVVTPNSRWIHLYEFSNNTSILTGHHTMKFGVEVRNIIARSEFLSRARGEYKWSNLDDFVRDHFPTVLSTRGTGLGEFVQNRTAYYAFAQDSWKPLPRVTLEYGLRYEFTGTSRDENLQDLNGLANVDSFRDELCTSDMASVCTPSTTVPIFNTLPARQQNAILFRFGDQMLFRRPRADHNNFEPRLGLAWDVFGDGKTSARVAAGVAHDVLYGNMPLLLPPPQIQVQATESNACSFTPSPGWCTFVVGNNPRTSPAISYTNTGFIEGGALLPNVPPGTRINRFAARGATGFFVQSQERAPETYTWSLSVQREQFKDWVFEFRYVGNHSVHLPIQLQLNAATPNPVRLPLFLTDAEAQSANFAGAPTLAQFSSGTGRMLVPYGFTGSLTTFTSDGQSWYQGGSISVERRLAAGFHLNSSYTYSKTIDLIENETASSVLNPRRPKDAYDIFAGKGLSGLHRAHKFVASWIYDLPQYKGSGLLKTVSQGWQFVGSYIAESGQPVSILSSADTNGDGDSVGDTVFYNPAGQTNIGSDVNFVCWNGTATTIGSSAASCGGSGNVVGYVARNPNAQYIKGATGMVTNLGRNTYIMPGINTANLSVFKNVHVREKTDMQFRIEMYNAFNHSSYTLGSGNFTGQISPTSPAQTASGFVTPGSSQFLNKTIFSGGMGNAPFQRVIQWGVKLIF